MKNIKRKLYVAVLSCFLIVSMTGCSGNKNADNAQNSKDSISIYVGTSIFDASLDPIKGGMSYGYSFINSALLKVNPDSKYVCDLASDWSISDDALEYTFNLKKDIKFQDGSDFTAEDVVFTYKTVKENQWQNQNVDLSKLKDVEALDDYTVKFTLTEAYSPFLDTVAQLGIVPSDNYNSEEFDMKPIGTGPWKVVQYDTKQQIIVEANEDYYEGVPEIKKVNIVNMDSEAAFSNAKSGQLDIVMVAPNYASQKIDGMTINNRSTMDVRNVSLPCLKVQTLKDKQGKEVEVGNNVTSDKAVREALSIGIDRIVIINKALNGVGKKAVGFTSNLDWGGVVNYEDSKLDEAKKILEDAGWKDTDNDGIREKGDIKCEFNIYSSSNDNQRYLLSTALAEEAKKLGIQINSKQAAWDDIYKLVNKEPVLWGWGQYNPILLKKHFYSNKFLDGKNDNVVGYSNPEVDKLIDKAITTNNREDAINNWKQVQKLAYQDYPYLYLVNIEHSYFIKDSIDISESTQISHPHGHGAPIINNMKDWKLK